MTKESSSYDLTFYRTQMAELAHSIAAAATEYIQEMLQASPILRRRQMAAEIGVTLGSPGQEPDIMIPSMSLGGISKNDSTVDGVQLNLSPGGMFNDDSTVDGAPLNLMLGGISENDSTVDGVQLNLMGQDSHESTVDGVQLNLMGQVSSESTVDGTAVKVDGAGRCETSTNTDATLSRKGRSTVVISATLTRGLTAVPGLGVSLSRLEAGPDAGSCITSLRPGSVGELVIVKEPGLAVKDGLKIAAINGVSMLSASLKECGKETIKSTVARLELEKNPFGFARLQAQYSSAVAAAAEGVTEQEGYLDIADEEESAAVTTEANPDYLPASDGDAVTSIKTGYLPVEPTGAGHDEQADQADAGRAPDTDEDEAPGLFVLAEEDVASEGEHGTESNNSASDNAAPGTEIVPTLEHGAVAIAQNNSGLHAVANAITSNGDAGYAQIDESARCLDASTCVKGGGGGGCMCAARCELTPPPMPPCSCCMRAALIAASSGSSDILSRRARQQPIFI